MADLRGAVRAYRGVALVCARADIARGLKEACVGALRLEALLPELCVALPGADVPVRAKLVAGGSPLARLDGREVHRWSTQRTAR